MRQPPISRVFWAYSYATRAACNLLAEVIIAVVVARLALIIYFSVAPLNFPDIESSVYTIEEFVYWE